ncbi:hypothetical protein TrVE_jg3166 [Triparma verrucosa]|uniref:Uncharacterized protein n=2 Tax=Triparma TaxID=722752 RepID=A0A9W7C0N7_9STRA|nr:hypothetical protein TrST_g934 [Triparma strigata]GMI15635.1 hypothetical protein TrVE_jg3166 [Triparma verrucosa]
MSARSVSGERNRGFRSPEWQTGPPTSRNSSSDKAPYKRISEGGPKPEEEEASGQGLIISFCLMLLVGSGNKVFQKLQTLPMYNYPNFLNLLTTFMYIPLSFLYILPVAKFNLLNGTISPEQLSLPKTPFAIMGFLDCLAGIMQIFAATYLPGPLLILLSQMAIPVSMILSKNMLNATYRPYQYVGACVVAMGIIVVLSPSLNDSSTQTCQAYDEDKYCSICEDITEEDTCNGQVSDEDSICHWDTAKSSSVQLLIWAGVMVVSCVPMTLSSIYKEKALGDTELDPVFLNGWIAVFQFAFSIPLAVPAALAGQPPIYPGELWGNLKGGLKCWVGGDSIDNGCNPDDCDLAPLFVNVYLLFNVSYNILIILILKFGNANILWLAMTIMVPVGNLTFALPFMKDYGGSSLQPTDIIGLLVIMGGLCMYRFGASAWNRFFGEAEEEMENDDGTKPLLSPVTEEVNRTRRLSSEEPEKVGGIGRVGKSF